MLPLRNCPGTSFWCVLVLGTLRNGSADCALCQYGTGFPNATQFNVDVPSFFTDMAAYISSLDVADWKACEFLLVQFSRCSCLQSSHIKSDLTWHTINNAASLLTPKIAETQFDFFG